MNSIEKKLPIMIPPFETYQGMAFVMGIILSHERLKNFFYNSYIPIRCNNTKKMWNVTLELSEVLWDTLMAEGICELDLFHSSNLAPDYFVEFLKERIDQGNYLTLYYIDEYYLSYSTEYQKRHFIHDVYIYGYEENDFCVMAYKEDKLQLFNVHQDEIRDAFYGCNGHGMENVDFCSCRPWAIADVSVDYDRIKRNIKEYLQGKEEGDYVYGILIYQSIKSCLLELQNMKCKDKIDIRIFRMLWEHKVSLRMHLEKLGEVQSIDNYMEDAIKAEEIGKKLFRLSLKYRMTSSVNTLVKILELVEELEQKEREYLTRLVASFS